ncbi:MAG: transglycosylase SLT domain-containing protein [Magnetococcales bacterium]|nr:transglycosylase SLT domain-containing protein [Magnetococcales bacterium]NGZ05522.1 transglycosylase SLT domain-containing protein [Magnetococcales bacterium]
MGRFWWRVVWWGWVCVGLTGCASAPVVQQPDNACAIFQDQGGWYEATRKAWKKWGVPIPVQLAIIHQESRFKHDAKPARSRLFWFIPGPRPSSAFGYAQALDETWESYKKNTGSRWADRDDFADAVDFIGWYVDVSHRKCGIAKSDARLQYLAYHEGQQGYNRKSYKNKKWLLEVALRVERNAERYREQLARCRPEGESGGWRLWPF